MNPNIDKYKALNRARRNGGYNRRRSARNQMLPTPGAFGDLLSTGRETDRNHYAELAVGTRGETKVR